MTVVDAVMVVDHRETVCGLGCRPDSRSNRGLRARLLSDEEEEQERSGRQKRDNIV